MTVAQSVSSPIGVGVGLREVWCVRPVPLLVLVRRRRVAVLLYLAARQELQVGLGEVSEDQNLGGGVGTELDERVATDHLEGDR